MAEWIEAVAVPAALLLVVSYLLLAWLSFLADCFGMKVADAPDCRTVRTTGVVVLGVEEDVENGRCAVCGAPLGVPVRRCGRCRTPHHHECWAYAGGCAIFACDRR